MPGSRGVVAAALGADALDGEVDVDLAGLGEFQRRLETLALLELLLQADKHHVIAARVERDGLARLDLDAAGDRPHLHHAAFHFHLMDFEAFATMSVEPPTRRSGAVPLLVIFM